MTNYIHCFIVTLLLINILSESRGIQEIPTGIVVPAADPVIRTCGGIIEGSSGTISYKEGVLYRNRERCIWTIRTLPGTMYVELIKYPTNFEWGYDWISVFSFVEQEGHSETLQLGKTSDEMEEFVVRGSVVIISFTTDSSVVRNGFKIAFKAIMAETPMPNPTRYDFNTRTVSGHVEYLGNYPNYYEAWDFSTFVISNGETYKVNQLQLRLDWYDIEYHPTCAYDALLIYEIKRETLELTGKICGTSENPSTPVVGRDFVVMFVADEIVPSRGFRLSWDRSGSDFAYSYRAAIK